MRSFPAPATERPDAPVRQLLRAPGRQRPPHPKRATPRRQSRASAVGHLLRRLFAASWRRPTPGQRFAAAGQVLGIGLVCFGFWLMLDARQLDANALASPPGARRSVSLAILGPIARIEEFFGADRVVDGANRALGRAASAPNPSTPIVVPPPPPTRTPVTATTGHSTLAARGLGVILRPSHNLLSPSASSATPPATLPTPPGPGARPGAPPLVTPTAAHPLTVLQVGDSLGVDLGYGLTDVLGNNPTVHLETKAVIDTGLANVAYYNWPATLAKDLRTYHPHLVVVMVGGNDTQNFLVGQRAAVFGTPLWRQQYGLRVETMMREATAAGARVVWVGMPQMQPGAPVSTAQMATLDSIYQQQAAKVPGVLYVPTWRVLANGKGQYSTYLPNASGSLVAVRDPDGVHLDYPAGDDLVAQAIVKAVHSIWKVQL